ncbi:MAG: DUF4384 domain-containing protein [Nitrospirales bacterium]
MSPTHKPWLLIGLCLFLAGCPAAAILIPPLIQFGASLLDSAVNNYDETHQQNMQTLLTALQHRTNPYMAQGNTASPYGQPGGYQQPGYPNQDYQTAQDYPPPQGYPSSPDYAQQPYDPYQTQQPQYSGNVPYPHDQYPNQGQQEYGYPNNSVNPNQQTSPPGNSSYPQNQYPQQDQQANGYPNNQNSYPNQNPYPNQTPYPNQPPYPDQNQPYPDTSYSMDQQGQPYPTPYDNTGIASIPAYSNQPAGTGEYETTQSETAQTTATPISLDVLLVKKHLVNGVQSYLPVKDGDVLLDGRGNSQTGDKFRVMFRANTDCYVYVIAVDGSAWAQGIFPSASSPFANPVKGGQQYLLPEGNNWFSLDQFKGIETVFFVASHERRPDIEQILATISGRERHPAEKPLAVSEPAIIPNGFSGARTGSAPFTFNTSQTTRQELLPTTYFVKTAGEDLRITRWFRHQ